MLRRADRGGLEIVAATLDDAVGDFGDHFRENETQAAAQTVIGRCDVAAIIVVARAQ